MNELKALEAQGFTMPTPAYFAGVILFSILGYVGYRFGKKATNPTVKWIGVALMLFPYVVTDTLMLYIVGAGLCLGIYVYRKG